MYKQSTVTKIFKRTFPHIEVIADTISDGSLIEIFKSIDPCINFDNPDMRKWATDFGNVVCAKKFYVAYHRAKFNPSGERGGSRRLVSFWTIRGWSEEEAKQKVSKEQSSVSKRCIDYWLARGYDEEAARLEVSRVQTSYADRFWDDVNVGKRERPLAAFDFEYYVKRDGVSEDEAKAMVVRNSKRAAEIYMEKTTPEERRAKSHISLDYHLNRGVTVEEYEEYMRTLRSTRTVSKSSIAFFDEFTKLIPSNKVYYGDKEYGKFIRGTGYVRYDYTDLQNMFIVEYDGVYWHSKPYMKERDVIKEEYAKSLGFLFFRLTDNDHRKKIVTPESLSERIKCELSKR